MASVSEELIGASFFLPDEISVEILSKVTDLGTLCSCKCVSRRFYQIACQVACQVDTISLIAPASMRTDSRQFRRYINSFFELERDPRYPYDIVSDRSVGGLMESMKKFTRLRSLYIELSSSSFNGFPFLKWKVFTYGSRIKSFVILSPTSIHDTKRSSYGDHEKEPASTNVWDCHIGIARICLEDVFVRNMMLFGLAKECPFLDKISITDRCKRGRISLSGKKLSEVRNWRIAPHKVDLFHHKVSTCRIPLLELPVSGLVMKGVELVLYEDFHLPAGYSYNSYVNVDDDEDDFEDKEEAAYSEAVMEIFKKHRNRISLW